MRMPPSRGTRRGRAIQSYQQLPPASQQNQTKLIRRILEGLFSPEGQHQAIIMAMAVTKSMDGTIREDIP